MGVHLKMQNDKCSAPSKEFQKTCRRERSSYHPLITGGSGHSSTSGLLANKKNPSAMPFSCLLYVVCNRPEVIDKQDHPGNLDSTCALCHCLWLIYNVSGPVGEALIRAKVSVLSYNLLQESSVKCI